MFEKDKKHFKKGWFEFTNEGYGKIRVHHILDQKGSMYTKKEAKELKEWLDEATKDRYEVITLNRFNTGILSSSVFDNELNETVVTFYPLDGFDCIARAEDYCEQLNEG